MLFQGGDNSFQGMRAVEIFHALNSGPYYAQKVSYQEAAQYAKQGISVVLASDDGHVALVAPADLQKSGSWNKDVNMVYNVGMHNGYMKASEAFNKNHQPTAFVMTADIKSLAARSNRQAILRKFGIGQSPIEMWEKMNKKSE